MNSKTITLFLMLLFGVLRSRADNYVSNSTLKPEPHNISDLITVPQNNRKTLVLQRQSNLCTRSYQLSQPEQVFVLTSPNYNREYPNNIDRSACFTSPSGTTMSVVCDDFNVEHHPQCSYDYLGIGLSGNPSSIYKYCGRGIVRSPATSGNTLALVFRSDYINPRFPNLFRDPYRFRCKITVSKSCRCGLRNGVSRIVGGTNAGLNEFPWRCYLNTNTIPFFCGCSIISNKWILTAAHCTTAVMPLPQGDAIYVVVGAHNRDSTGEQIPVERVHNHPDFIYLLPYLLDSDISLLKLSRPITFNNAISPICLPFNYANDEFAGTTGTVSGWGKTIEADKDSISNTLQKVDLPVLTTAQCRKYHPSQITERMICTYQPGKSFCDGDSGGSIDLNRNGRYYNIGVVSWRKSCGGTDQPVAYAKTTKFLNWITSTTGEYFCRA